MEKISNFMDTKTQTTCKIEELAEGARTLAKPTADLAWERVTIARERPLATCTHVRLQHILGQPVREYYRG
jgi:hypothetical protein